uniref:mitogen-activated protein kinase kinase n=1 Tax=Steinernema glaseri TaxID=37863 RepID=A0A1I7Z507_9BILA
MPAPKFQLDFSNLPQKLDHENGNSLPQFSISGLPFTGTLNFPASSHKFTSANLDDQGEIGRGMYGTVNKMLHRETGNEVAVKRIPATTVNTEDRKRLEMELKTITACDDCDNIVKCYGAIFAEGCCWICMELLDISLDRLYKDIYAKNQILPEDLVGFIAASTVNALNYLKHKNIIHRDVKPSNILLDRKGSIKLCDFGIAGCLVDSIARTRDVGCRPYMAPERLSEGKYDIRADVWSLGISLIEICTGSFPYASWTTPFEQVDVVVNGDPPVMRADKYSIELVSFVNLCLVKDKKSRPKYDVLITEKFYLKYNDLLTDPLQKQFIGQIVAETIKDE